MWLLLLAHCYGYCSRGYFHGSCHCLAVCARLWQSTARASPKVDAGSAVTLNMVQGPGAPCGSASPKVDAAGSTVASKGELIIADNRGDADCWMVVMLSGDAEWWR